jgi:Domain of unknown function (DUF5615)
VLTLLSPHPTKDATVNSDVSQALFTATLAQSVHVALVPQLVLPQGVEMDTAWVGASPSEHIHGAGKDPAKPFLVDLIDDIEVESLLAAQHFGQRSTRTLKRPLYGSRLSRAPTRLSRVPSMPWREMDDPSDDDIQLIRGVRRAKLYVDENVEEFVVDMLRAMKVNVLSARELDRHRGKPDGFHAAFAFKKKRSLVTKNARDFLDDRKLPWEKTFGVIAIADDLGDTEAYASTLRHVLQLIVPIGEWFEGTKTYVTPNEVTIKGRTRDGRIEKGRYRMIGDRMEQWQRD